jgi:DNA processing protein
MRKYGSAKAALDNWFQEPLAQKVSLTPLQTIEDEIAKTHQQGFRLSFYTDPDYPPLLRNAVSPSPVLTVKGDLSLCQRTCVAIVGARNASYQGKSLAYKIAQDLGNKGVAIVSGLARGIDTAAHRGSLTTGTVGVMAGGIDIIYPEENKDLYDKMGLVLTDMPLGMMPQAVHFPKRNRLIAALCQAVVVIEAAYQSGSLLTAKFATEEGREVFSVPGSPLDPRCRGSNLLLKKGAALVESAQDILDLLNPQLETATVQQEKIRTSKSRIAEDKQIDNTVQDRILMALSHTPTAGDQILQSCRVPAMMFWSVIADLEMQGKLIRSAGNYLALSVQV